MFGLRSFFGRSGGASNASIESVQPSEPIFISDYIGTAEPTEPGSEPGSGSIVNDNPINVVSDAGFYAASPDKSIITLKTLTNFNSKRTEFERIFNHKIAGCDGEFPVTNPVKNNIYFNKADNKYYICKNGSTGTVTAPDSSNFEYISLKNASGGNAVKGITLTGSATGTGSYNEDTGVYTVATSVQYANVKGTPTSLKNPNKLTISLNGNNTEYDGSSIQTVSITPGSIGAQIAGDYAVNGHSHTVTNITDMPKSMPSPYGLTLQLNGVAQTAYTGSKAVDINITPAGIGAQPAGNYAASVHNHDTQYNTKTEITSLLAGKLGKSENAVSATKLATARTISLTGAVTGSVSFDGSGNAAISTTLAGFDASKISSGIISVDRLPKSAFSDFVAVKDKTARLALTQQEVQNGDTVKETDTGRMYLVIDDSKLSAEDGYQEYTTIVDWNTITGKPSSFTPSTHTHTWSQISDRPSTMANPNALTISLNGKAQTAYTGASAVAFDITPASIGAQVAGSYAAANHNHDSAYAKVSHTHNGNQITALTGYVKAESVSAIAVTDSLIVALGKLEKALDSKQASGSYAPSSHNHSSANITSLSGYAKAASAAAISTSDSLNVALGKLEKALDGKQASGSYASSSHNHDSVYAKTSHTHTIGQIGALAGYTKASSVSAVTTSDTILTAIGKLEKALDGKQASGSYASSSHNHDTAYAAKSHAHAWGEITGKPSSFTPAGHNQASNTITAMTGYSKASAVAAISTSDSLNTAISKLEKALDGKQAAGSYAAASHNHDLISGTYTGNGGVQQPSYVPSGKVRFNMMNNNINGDGGYKDWLLMDTYSGSDVPYVTAFGITKSTSIRAYLMQGAKNGKAWDRTAEIWHSANFNPNTKLNTSGGTISGALTVTGQILSNADVVAYSDKRVKTNVVKIDDALNKVDQISGYTYDMQGLDFKGKRQAGVIAQELLEVLPEAVVQDDNGMYAVRYTNIIPLLIEAVKEERAARIAEVKSLEERLAKIEKMLENK